MARMIRNAPAEWTKPVDEIPVEPHRYRYDECNDDYRYAATYREFITGVPYQRGHVVYVSDNGKLRKALILDVRSDRDRYGDRREMFRIAFATAGDTWSKLFNYTYSGPIQRGYKIAGLAPEMPDNA